MYVYMLIRAEIIGKADDRQYSVVDCRNSISPLSHSNGRLLNHILRKTSTTHPLKGLPLALRPPSHKQESSVMAENHGYAESLKEAEAPPPYNATDSRPNAELPSYQDVQNSTYDGAPPSYESLFGKIKATRRSSKGFCDFLKSVFALLIGTIGFTVFLAFMLAIPIAMIVIGAKYLGDCPAERYIPIYLIVAGCFSTARNLSAIVRRCKAKLEGQDAEEENNKKVHFLETVVDCFMIAWFIAGNVWIYRTRHKFSTNPEADNFCDPVLYWFAFWVTTAMYMLMGCCCAVGCFVICIASFLPA